MFLAVLSISFVGSAIFVGFDPIDVLRGLLRVEMPDAHGGFDQPWRVGVAMIGAVGGSIMNLAYPYFLDAKGWRGPEYRRVQMYDFVLAVTAMMGSTWPCGRWAPSCSTRTAASSPRRSPGPGEPRARRAWPLLFYAGIFSAIYTSILGHAAGLASLGTHAWLGGDRTSRRRTTTPAAAAATAGLRSGASCRRSIWTLPGMPDFVALTLAANSAQVVLVPMLAGGLWWITASPRFIGERYRTRWWENIVMAVLFGLAAYFAIQAIRDLVRN